MHDHRTLAAFGRSIVGGLATMLLLVACSGSASQSAPTDASTTMSEASAPAPSAPTIERPAVFTDLPVVELLAPGSTNAGDAPTFSWRPVEQAAAYRLAVLASDAPTWAWQGTTTTIRYGGVEAGVSGPSLQPGSWWSVAALSAEGDLIAMSALRAVSPGDDPGTTPAWTTVDAPAAGTATSGSTAAPTAAPAASAAATVDGGHACDLVTADEIAATIGGTWVSSELSAFGATASWCDWRSENGTLLQIAVSPADQYDPVGWGADATFDGLGSAAYRVDHGWDRRIGFVDGAYSVMLIIDYTRVDPAGYLAFAQRVAERLE